MLWLAVLLLAIASVALAACGSGSSSDDKALFDKVTEPTKTPLPPRRSFAADANLYWNWPVLSGGPAEMTTGIVEISALVASGDMGHPTPLGDDVFTYVPSAEDIKNLTAAYDGARYIAGPVCVGRDIYLMIFP